MDVHRIENPNANVEFQGEDLQKTLKRTNEIHPGCAAPIVVRRFDSVEVIETDAIGPLFFDSIEGKNLQSLAVDLLHIKHRQVRFVIQGPDQLSQEVAGRTRLLPPEFDRIGGNGCMKHSESLSKSD